MTGESLRFGGGAGVAVLATYAALMLLIGWWAGRKRPQARASLEQYYLAGKGLGAVVLFFTLYASQYSGNTLVGYAPAAYRQGYPWWQSVWFFTAVVAAYLVYAPRLFVVARRERFITPTDWIRHRFGSEPLAAASAALMLWALGNYLLEQLVAIGQGVSGLTGNTVPYQVGVLAFVVVMLTYAWMGGMQAVALTDVMQGVALLVGVVALTAGGLTLVGGDLSQATEAMLASAPNKAAVPPLDVSVRWFGLVVLVGLGASIYPHAVQRIYAARSERVLRQSLGRMALMPPLTAGLVCVVGIIGVALFPGLDTAQSEQLVGLIANRVASLGVGYTVAMLVLFGGVVAAIVSTADSVLLSFSSIVSRDLYARYLNPHADEARQVRVGKACGVAVVAVLLVIAWYPPTTLYSIFVLKLELLVQLAPAFFLGMHWRGLTARPVLWGMIAGALLAGSFTVLGVRAPLGLQSGIVGLALNLGVCVCGSWLEGRSAVTRLTH